MISPYIAVFDVFLGTRLGCVWLCGYEKVIVGTPTIWLVVAISSVWLSGLVELFLCLVEGIKSG